MKARVILLLVGLFLSFGIITTRLFYWQILSSDTLRGMLEQQTFSQQVLTPDRGKIFARDGSPLVLNKPAYLLYGEPQKIKNIDSVAALLSQELGIPSASISGKLATSLQWVPLANKVSEDKKKSIERGKLEGIGFQEVSIRYYPESSMAAQLLGFVGKDAKGEDTGYFGIEGYYNEQLKGRPGILQQERDSKGIPILFGNAQESAPSDGRNLTLTIDKTVQFIAEQKLMEGVWKYGAKGGTVTIMDPSTGEILAMASYPSYDPSDIANYDADYLKNPAIASSYEPGSTFKVLVMASALNENKVTPDTIYQENGPVQMGNYAIRTWNQEYHGPVNLAKILEYSSNVGMVFIQRDLGDKNLLDYIKKLGFGQLTSIDLQEEASPLLRDDASWKPIDFATASFGQGIAVTPLQMVSAVTAVANGGRLMKPYVVKAIQAENGKVISVQPTIRQVIFRKETARQMAVLMESAVENGETKRLKPAGFRIAGKTGTAQIAIAGHYDTEKTIASFVGFAPVDNPRFVMLVTFQEPTSSPWGSETAAPVFFSIAKELFPYFNISPT